MNIEAGFIVDFFFFFLLFIFLIFCGSNLFGWWESVGKLNIIFANFFAVICTCLDGSVFGSEKYLIYFDFCFWWIMC